MRRLALSLALSLLPLPALSASPVQGTGQATAAVANSCVIVAADNVAFGAYSPISGLDATASGQVTLRCTKGAAYTVVPTSGGSALRGTGGSLAYALYVDSAQTQQWGSSQATGSLPFDTSKKYAGGNGQGVLATFSSRPLTAIQFTANPAYATQPYAVTNNNGAYTYYVGFVGQVVNPTQLAAFGDAYPGSGYTNINTVSVGGSALPTSGTTTFMLPPGTAKSGTTYQVPTGYSGAFSLKGTANSSLTNQAVTYYGKVPASQDMVPGTYTDTVVFTVTF